jgi:hypothetical protein
MRLHLGDYWGALVWRNEQSVVDRRQRSAFKGDIENRPADCGHPSVYCLHLFHIVSSDPGYLSSSRKGYGR